MSSVANWKGYPIFVLSENVVDQPLYTKYFNIAVKKNKSTLRTYRTIG